MQRRIPFVVTLLAWAAFVAPGPVSTEPVTVRHPEGLVHGFLALHALDGALLASGDVLQHVTADRVTSQVIFHFKDGSIQDETAVFFQRGRFQLISYHLIQRGPAFQQPMEMSIDAATGQVSVRYGDEGKEETESEHLDLPPDVANGIVPILLKNLDPAAPLPTVSMVAATPKPRLVKLMLSVAGTDPFSIAGSTRRATHYVLKVAIGGIAGVVAPILGKQPPDVHVWVLGGDTPAFLKSEGPLFYRGAPWRIELTSPVWPNAR